MNAVWPAVTVGCRRRVDRCGFAESGSAAAGGGGPQIRNWPVGRYGRGLADSDGLGQLTATYRCHPDTLCFGGKPRSMAPGGGYARMRARCHPRSGRRCNTDAAAAGQFSHTRWSTPTIACVDARVGELSFGRRSRTSEMVRTSQRANDADAKRDRNEAAALRYPLTHLAGTERVRIDSLD